MVTSVLPMATDPAGVRLDLDVVIIGAGFSGLYMLHRLRDLGFRAQVLEMGDGVGGTWYWNRYPGARCDVQSIEYSFSFSPEIEQEWEWTELMPGQAEVERYLNFVCDRLDLRTGVTFSTRVVAAIFDEPSSTWTVTTDGGTEISARFVVAATGCLSAPLAPPIEGRDTFSGVSLYTSRFPKEGFDFTGKRVAVIGTGSSGVQSIPIIAQQARHLLVFQRSAAYTLPSTTRPLEPGELDALKADYANIRRRQREAFAGTVRFGAFAAFGQTARPNLLDTAPAEQLRAIDEHGWLGAFAWPDVMLDMEANRAATALYGELIRRVVDDPETAASLVPQYPFGCKRVIIDVGYFETYNRDNVTLVDLRKDALERITPAGIETDRHVFDLDVIVFATGFDAMTGALGRIDIRGRGGERLQEAWTDGPRTYLGLQSTGFPNLFTITGPGSPSVLTNMLTSIEQHVEWIGSCLQYLRDKGYRAIEASRPAQEAWVGHVLSTVSGRINSHPSCSSWYLGANVRGKPRVFMPYAGGVPAYRQKCNEVVAAGYEGFLLT
jgi:cation diffusion facilitator CzcD-associated flavoprotein CzcO